MKEKERTKLIAANIKKLIKENGLTQKRLSEEIGISQSTMSDYMNYRSNPSHGVIQKIADYFGVLKSDIDTTFKENNIDSDITTIYNQLNQKYQTKVYNYAEKQLDKQNNIIEVNFNKEDLTEVYVAYDVSAGVGYGNDYELTDYDIEYTNERLRNYDFAFRINGDSMEPELITGDVALVQRTETVDNGSIYVVSYSDSLYVKEVRIEDDVFVLHSLNPKYQDIPIDLVDNDEPPRIIGKVVDSFTPLQVN